MDEATLELRMERKARVVVGRGSLARLPSLVAGMNPHQVLIIVDSGVPRQLAHVMEEGLRGEGLKVYMTVTSGGEGVKTLSSVEGIWKIMAEVGMTRGSLLLAMGGGALLDAAGFAAATYMRGIMSAYIPTTTLAQSDASIGGKTGIDLPWSKNIVGVFYHPELVVIDPEILLGLPDHAYITGFSEVVKHAAIRGREWVTWLMDKVDGIRARDPDVLTEVVRFSVETKLDIIRRDYLEKGLRTLLNFGHTLGHALEVASGYRISHGEAVSAGIVAESLLAQEIAGFPGDEAELLRSLLEMLGLPTRINCQAFILLQAMRRDKKFTRGKPRIPLPRRLGEFTVEELSWGVVESWLSKATR